MGLISKFTSWLDSKPWWHYYYSHAIIAVAIQQTVFWSTNDLFAGTLAGFIFYLSRKICEYTYNVDPANRWDWPGLLWPTAAVLLVHGFIRSA